MNVNEYHQAAASGNASLVQQYLTKGMKVDARGANNTTALMWAASCGHLEVVNILLDAGADPTLEDQDRWTAGMSAESLGYAQIAQILDTSSCRTPVK
jgi:ankyrin repeat protein